jgi:2',3'-cyclic-nucleotide 2'-phosphodiesterase (5'-nucleotidase family)
MSSAIQHPSSCACSYCKNSREHAVSRKIFLKNAGLFSAGMGLSAISGLGLSSFSRSSKISRSKAVVSGNTTHITLLHTADIHGQLLPHDEFFWENNQAVFKKRGGFAHLKTMIRALRAQNPNTFLADGGDCFQGSAVAALSQGQAIVPLMNNIGYDLVLPGNWEVVYGKKMLIKNMEAYKAAKVCGNMFHEDTQQLMFPPYHVFSAGNVKIGLIGYNDPLTPVRQSPAYSFGIKFCDPEKNIASYITLLKQQEKCDVVIAITHMGLAQQLHLSGQPYAQGLDYILGADTHERIRQPLQGKYAKVTEPGSFASFVSKLDLIIEDGKIKEDAYELLEVDPEKYEPDKEMEQLIEQTYSPYNKQIKRVLGKTKTTLMRYFVIETPMDNLITDAVMWKAKPDIAVSNGFRFCPPLVPDSKTGEADITEEYLWSMLPVDSDVKMAEATGQQLRDWMERELENVFAKGPTKRFGGWLVRFQGMKIKFTINKEQGNRIEEMLIQNAPVDPAKIYTIAACEREGDPDNVLCRIKGVKNTRKLGYRLHAVMEAYLKEFSPVSPKTEGRAVATDAPSTLLTQVEGVNYYFR